MQPHDHTQQTHLNLQKQSKIVSKMRNNKNSKSIVIPKNLL